MESFWNNSNLLDVFMKRSKQIVIISFLGTIIIGASTYLIQPKYKSFAIVYPANLEEFSDESTSEQMVQILKSRDIADKVMTRFDIPAHYELDSAYKHFQSVLYYLYNDNVSIKKTEYEAVEIRVLDTDPDTACAMVNSIMEFYNDKVRTMQNNKLNELINLSKQHVADLKKEKDTLESRMHVLNVQHGLLDYYIQTERLTEGLYRTGGHSNLQSNAEAQLEELKKYGTEYYFLSAKRDSLFERYLHYNMLLKQQMAEYNSPLTFLNVVTEPYVTDDKYSPKRILITFFGGLSLFILLLVIIAFLEKKKHSN